MHAHDDDNLLQPSEEIQQQQISTNPAADNLRGVATRSH
jgi:hypothetical protein